MKKTFLAILSAIALLAFTSTTVHAQLYGVQSLLSGGTNNVSAAATNTVNGVIALPRATDV